MQISRLTQVNFNANFGRKHEDDEKESFRRMAKTISAHPTAKVFINEHNPSILSPLKNSIRAGHLAAGDPKFTISINDYIVKTGEDTYESDRVHPSRNAAVDGNINISKINGEGSTLVAINYPVHKSHVSEGDLKRAVKKYDKLVQKTLKALK